MRGKVSQILLFLFSSWITPAHAGKRPVPDGLSRDLEDHPRTCGEKAEDIKARNIEQGSPPHMRGKELLEKLLQLMKRITPAHAGKSNNFRILL